MNAVDEIATTLGETEKTPLATIERVLKVLGEEKALALLAETVRVEAEGGLLTDDKARRRSPGGVFFKLVKNRTTSKERGRIFGPPPKVKHEKPEIKPITWAESEAFSNEVLELPQGEATTVKVTIIGRPGRIIEKEAVVITSMQNSRAPSLPKGLPPLPEDPTTYIVYIAMKQWRKVRSSIKQNPEDKLIIEGYPRFDRRVGQRGAMTIYAQSVTTTLIQQARREAMKQG